MLSGDIIIHFNILMISSGTYNNQWMVMDFKVLNESAAGQLKDGFLTVLEQLPGKFVVEDQTSVLRSKTYWASYNRAFYPEIFELSGAPGMVERFGDWMTYDQTPRAKIFARDHSKVCLTERVWKICDQSIDILAIQQGLNRK